ncbi:MAG: hypothetical protein AAF533_20635 [Acidobacteriota bacterium]
MLSLPSFHSRAIAWGLLASVLLALPLAARPDEPSRRSRTDSAGRSSSSDIDRRSRAPRRPVARPSDTSVELASLQRAWEELLVRRLAEGDAWVERAGTDLVTPLETATSVLRAEIAAGQISRTTAVKAIHRAVMGAVDQLSGTGPERDALSSGLRRVLPGLLAASAGRRGHGHDETSHRIGEVGLSVTEIRWALGSGEGRSRDAIVARLLELRPELAARETPEDLLPRMVQVLRNDEPETPSAARRLREHLLPVAAGGAE